MLNDGRKIAADVIILATGYRSSWETLFDGKKTKTTPPWTNRTDLKNSIIDETAQELGIFRHTLPPSALAHDEWASYQTLRNPPSQDSAKPSLVSSSIYRGIVPAKNINRRDFAINGAIVRDSPPLPLKFWENTDNCVLAFRKQRIHL